MTGAPRQTARWERATRDLVSLGARGLTLDAYRGAALQHLRSSLAIDAAFFATVDPTTMLFTSALAEAPLAAATPQFLDNEYADQDVNKFTQLASAHDPVASLDQATGGDRTRSARYRNVLAPAGLGDELRVALVAGGLCWGVLCLHRADSPSGFDELEVDAIRRIAPTLAHGLRRTVALHPTTPDDSTTNGPGIIIVDAQLSVASMNPRAESLLDEVTGTDWPTSLELPAPLTAVAARLLGPPGAHAAGATTISLPRGRGGWITVHASCLDGSGTDRQVALILDTTSTAQLGSLMLAAHGLTSAQSRVVALVLQGRSTPAITRELRISTNTLQEHLHAVFEKLGVGSRRELVNALSPRGPH